jgi:hypothetical protein
MDRRGQHRPVDAEVVGNRAGTESAVGDGDDGRRRLTRDDTFVSELSMGVVDKADLSTRCQERQQRTWCSSSPHSPLVAWKDSSILQRHPATRARVARDVAAGRRSGRRPPVARLRRTSSQRPQPAGAPSWARRTRVQAYQRLPLAPSPALMASQPPAGHLRPGRWPSSAAGAWREGVSAPHGQHVWQLVGLQPGAQGGLMP